jgi:DNA-binding NarL/FixJ family response regulator
LVDDFAPWRRLIHTLLKKRPELQIVCEVSDGLDAVQKARELKPDLILLDIGLPTLNGIGAAQRIRNFAPKSKILFVSENYSEDIAREALGIGGCGYVIKSDAGTDLLAAVDAVILGKQFVSARLASQFSDGVTNPQSLDRRRIKEILATFSTRFPRNQKKTRCHEAQFYSDEAHLLNRLTRFVGGALRAGNVVVALPTEPHRDSFVEGLQAHGLDVRAATQRGTYISLDVAQTISRFMVNDRLDPVRYLEGMADLVESALRAATSARPRVAVYGELTVPLLAQGNADAAIQIEQLSNAFANEYDLDILCMYPTNNYFGKITDHVLQRICAEHSAVHSQ